MSADPYKSGSGSGTPSDPASWNKYSYVEGDPINQLDPAGEFMLAPEPNFSLLYSSLYGGYFRQPIHTPLDTPVWQDEWDNLTEECQRGLRTKFGANASIKAIIAALNRAVAQTAILAAAGDAHGIDPALLGAIGLRESGFRNIAQDGWMRPDPLGVVAGRLGRQP